VEIANRKMSIHAAMIRIRRKYFDFSVEKNHNGEYGGTEGSKRALGWDRNLRFRREAARTDQSD
jgi:hypothetical protein